MKKGSWAALLVAVALCLAVAAPVAAANSERPFWNHNAGNDSVGDVSTCPSGAFVRYVSSGTGDVMHLGRASLVVTHCVWMESGTSGRFGSGTMTFTAASGDMLILSQQGTFQFDAFPPSTSTIDMTWVVVGGTGRFADATGSGVGTGTSDMVAGRTEMFLSGTIGY